MPSKKNGVDRNTIFRSSGSAIGDAYLSSTDSVVPINGINLFCNLRSAREDKTDASTSSTKAKRFDRLNDWSNNPVLSVK